VLGDIILSAIPARDDKPSIPEVSQMKHLLAALVLLVALLVSSVWSQTAATKSPLTLSQAALASWNEIGRKLIAMAEDFPEDKYDFKPVPAQRSFAEQLLHVAGSNDYFTDVVAGKKPVDDESRDHYKTKAAVVAYLKKSFDAGAAVIKSKRESPTRSSQWPIWPTG
jgi:hypothetical protein